MNEPPQWFIKHLAKHTEKSKGIKDIIKFLPVKMKMEGNSWTKKFVEKNGMEAVFNILRLYIDCVVIGTKGEKEILTHTALSLNYIFQVSPKLLETEFIKIDKSVEVFSRLIDSHISDLRWNTLLLLTTLAIANEQGYKLVFDAMKERFPNVCMKLKTDTTFEKKTFIMKFLAVMITHGKAYALKHQILGELKENELPEILGVIDEEIKKRKDTHAYHDNKEGAKDLTKLMEAEMVIIRRAFDAYDPRYNDTKIQRVYETLIFKINQFSDLKKQEMLENLNILLNSVLNHVDEHLGSQSHYDSDDEEDAEDDERLLDNKMNVLYWKGLHDVSLKKVDVSSVKKSLRNYQGTLRKMKKQLDNIRVRHTIERLEFTKEKVAIIKYVEKLNENLNFFLDDKELEDIPEDSPRSVMEIYTLMKRMKQRHRTALQSQKK